MGLQIGDEKYKLEYDLKDPYVTDGLKVAYSDRLAEDFVPVIYDPRGHGSKPLPPELIAYRLIVDQGNQKICILYEVYWRRQDCTWRELNKDHDHDYEQIQVHLDVSSGEVERVVVSSVGPIDNGGHGVEVFVNIPEAKASDVKYITSPIGSFPWGGVNGREGVTQLRWIPLERLCFENGRPSVVVLNCYHVFAGLKRRIGHERWSALKPRLRRLDRKCLDIWYHRHSENRFGHDVSKPFEEPHIFYYPPPEDLKSRLAYRLLRLYYSIKKSKQRICERFARETL